MDPAGIGTWIGTAIVVGVAVGVVAQMLEPAPLFPQAAYLAVAAFLATFMGSEAFSWISEKGPEFEGFYIITGVIFGLIITSLAAAASRAPAPATREDI